jgi:tRNA threonylcarbamoyladenosine biosynthesis protein TsaE
MKTKNSKETIELGKKIARKLKGGEIIALEGDLGAGKTTLIKGIARGLGIKKTITSPTFVIMKIYAEQCGNRRGTMRKLNLLHIDAYRIKNPREILDIGAGEYLGDKNTVVVIEWADKVKKLLRGKKVIWIKMKVGEEEGERELEIL